MTECKHILGYTNEDYGVVCNLSVGDVVYASEDVTLYAFCPLCGVNVVDIPVTEIKRKQAPDSHFASRILTNKNIARVALKMIGESINKESTTGNTNG